MRSHRAISIFLSFCPTRPPREKLFDGTVYQKLWGIPLAVDVIPYRHTAFEARSNWLMSLSAIALREGRLAYDATVVPTPGIA